MRTVLALVVTAIAGGSAWAFAPSLTLRCVHNRNWKASLSMGYIPDGLSADEWKKIQAQEKDKAANLGRVGPIRFKSRSFKAWQESGAGHLFPVDPKKVAKGEIPLDKVPYMQRKGGSWDDSDLASAKGQTSKNFATKKWSQTDKEYANGGYRKEQSVSIFGGSSLPWTSPKTSRGAKTNARRVEVQKGMKRPGTSQPMNANVKRRIEKEVVDDRKRKQKMETQTSEGKKGLFGLW